MPTLIERLFPGVAQQYRTQIAEATTALGEATELLSTASLNEGLLKESIRDLTLYLDDLGWIPVDGWEEEKGFPLKTIQDTADKLRALLAVNPTIKKAINARVGYIWSRGVTFEGGTGAIKAVIDDPHNQKIMFDPDAFWALEASLATDGNAFYVKGNNAPTISSVPLHHVGGWVVDPDDPTHVMYWLHHYTITTENFSTGEIVTNEIKVFIPSADNTKPKSSNIQGIPVDKSKRMYHIAANRQNGWVLGVPDLMAAMFWAKNFKELYESGSTYIKAQGKFAAKVVAKTGVGAGKAAATIANAPRRDPATGEILDVGGVAAMGGGLDYQLMGKMSGGVDFKSFDPVAGLIAVGLGIPLSVITGVADGEEVSLEASTVNEMRGRQTLWSGFFRELLGSGKPVKVIWPKIKTEPAYRQIQSIGLSNEAVTLSREELRALTLEAYELEGNPKDIPDIEQNAFYLLQELIVEKQTESQLKIQKQSQSAASDLATQNAETAVKVAAATPAPVVAKAGVSAQGKSGNVGKLSTGKDAKASRNNKADTNTKNA